MNKLEIGLLVLVLFLILLFSGINTMKLILKEQPFDMALKNLEDKNLKIVEIDDCEYLFLQDSTGQHKLLTHKGNCKNAVHVCN